MQFISTSRRARTTATTIYKLNVKDVPVDGFWSITLYNAEGYLMKNDQDAYSFNNITAKKNRRWFGHDSVRRVRRQNSQLSADHARLELHRASLSSPKRNSRRNLEVSGSAAAMNKMKLQIVGLRCCYCNQNSKTENLAIAQREEHE